MQSYLRLFFLLSLGGALSCGGVSKVKSEPDATAPATQGSGGGLTLSPPSTDPVLIDGSAYDRSCILDRLAKIPDAGDAGDEADAPDADSSDAGTEGGLALGASGQPLTVLVIMDKSGSMGEFWDERTKWQVANDAFAQAIEGVLDNLTIGAILFPEPDGCTVAPLSSGKQYDFEPGRAFSAHWQATAQTRSRTGKRRRKHARQAAARRSAAPFRRRTLTSSAPATQACSTVAFA
jgi:hypothetical protein